ncbi:MAG: hypothetical protein HY286_09790 [Planctomycetes bacterium]|nr:hypothetical protein [Planctomycetota bacterium]
MSWQKLLTSNRVEPHITSKAEIDSLRQMVERDLADADIKQLSDDRRFIIAYSAALTLAKITIACAGYRIKGVGGAHQTTFEALRLAMGESVQTQAIYFDRCRTVRNDLSYDSGGTVTENEVEEILDEVRDFNVEVESWISKNHAAFKL